MENYRVYWKYDSYHYYSNFCNKQTEEEKIESRIISAFASGVCKSRRMGENHGLKQREPEKNQRIDSFYCGRMSCGAEHGCCIT